jgi:1,4-alpha-glucan branching enzyme
MSVPAEFSKRLGFTHIEIKPNTASGLKTFNTQIRNWGYDPATVRAVTYDAQGNLRWGFDF